MAALPLREKLSIYPTPSPPIQLIESPPSLVPHIRVLREASQDVLSDGRDLVERGVEKWVGFERRVQGELKTIIPENEPLIPGTLYVGVAGLAGSVMARNRNFLIRFFLPPILAISSAPYFIPQTSHNIRSYLSTLEDTHFPTFSSEHEKLKSQLNQTVRGGLKQVEGLTGEVGKMTGGVARKVEESTGLKLGDVLRRGSGGVGEQQVPVVREASLRENTSNSSTENVFNKLKSEFPTTKTSVPVAPAPVETKVVGIVMEQIPVAEIVVPVGSPVEAVATPGALGTVDAVGAVGAVGAVQGSVEAVEKKKVEEKRLV